MTENDCAILMRYAETGAASPDVLRLLNEDAEAREFVRVLRDDLRAIDAVPDSPLAAERIAKEYARVELSRTGLSLLDHFGASVLTALPTRDGAAPASDVIMGSAYRIEKESDDEAAVVVYRHEYELIVTKDGVPIVERKGEGENTLVRGLTEGGYVFLIDGVEYALGVERRN